MNNKIQQTPSTPNLARRSVFGIAIITAVFGLLAGCASVDPGNVEKARASVAAATSDRQIDAENSLHLQESVRHLALAEAALEQGRWQEIADHHAYLADANARSAQALAAARVANEESGANMSRAHREAEQARLAVIEAARRGEEMKRRSEELQRRANSMAQRANQMTAAQTERGLVLTLGGVLFAFNSAELKTESQLSTARLAGFLIALGDRDVVVEGYTDNVGPEEYNVELSKRRAISVLDMLVESGVEAGRIVANGYGMDFPVASNETEADRVKNRRVEVVILEPGELAAESGRRTVEQDPEASDGSVATDGSGVAGVSEESFSSDANSPASLPPERPAQTNGLDR